jgi:polar amino acid transport system permease protein
VDFDFPYLIQHIPALMQGLAETVTVSVVAIVLSTLIGFSGAAARLLRVPFLSKAVALYVEVIRNTPILGQLFLVFYGLPSIGITLSLFWSGVLTLAVWAGAYQVENIRGGLETVSKGLKEAAFSLGLSPWRFFRLVAAPIAVRACLPAMLNTSISLLKNSSYLQVIGFAELTFVAMDRISADFRTIEMLSAICVIYLALILILSFFTHRLARFLNKPFVA